MVLERSGETLDGVERAREEKQRKDDERNDQAEPFVVRELRGGHDPKPDERDSDQHEENRRQRQREHAHELALSVVFESGFNTSRIDEYAAWPTAEWFLERVPAAWDDTVFLSGRPGSEATLARMHENDWFIGRITAGPMQTVEVSLSFLDAERKATIVRENRDGESLIREMIVCSPNETLSVDVAENGGFCTYLPE